MFFHTQNKTARAVAAGIDIAIDFATLGEYRVISDEAVTGATVTSAAGQASTEAVSQATVSDGDWAFGIEWSSPERTRATCSLPRARNREWASSRIRS
ncbi:MAG: hypothetical protein WAP35_01170 [Solirubrobacterales bacterium]